MNQNDMNEAYEVMGKERDKLSKQRDDLLAALQDIAGLLAHHREFKGGNSTVHYCAHKALSAINKATGEPS